jgi:4-amino-4-deoxy-L-arabinose transferase-like glycosyltransferase
MSSVAKSAKLDSEIERTSRRATEETPKRWCWLVLILLMVIGVWYRAHTFGPQVRDVLGVTLWPATVGEAEPLDCDEAAYAYIGHRILKGDVLYRDLTENKPPLGYWIYAIAIGIGGYNELSIRLMPIPFFLGTMAIVWGVALRLGGRGSALLAAGLYLILSADPYLFGNGSNLEHFINLFSIASLGLLVTGWHRCDRWCMVGAGACLGTAILVKQVAFAHVIVFAPFLLSRGVSSDGPLIKRLVRGTADLAAFFLGLFMILAGAALILLAWGAGRAAYDDIMLYGRALATDTLADPFAPPALIRWLTGNADPQGRLPWPFGSTDYLVWWGSGSWPLWLASIPATIYLLVGPKTTMPRRLAAAWTISAFIEVVLPGLYWQHYYLLPIAGVAIVVAVCWTDALDQIARRPRTESNRSQRPRHVVLAASAVLTISLAIGATAFLQIRDYLLVAPEELTIRYKGGRQWVALRQIGRELARRATIWSDPHLYVWGWQSPLYFYARLDSPTRHFFVDNLLRDQADRRHPLIEPRTEEIRSVLESRPPGLIFTGYPPFRALDQLLRNRYLPSRWVRGLWIEKKDYQRFEAAR